jgi:alpha-1,3-rhamnosyl/mannosyltransferase
MQCGCPVVTTCDPAVMEVSAGAAIHVRNTAEMALALRDLATGPELRPRLREAGPRRAAHFSWARTARATRAVYAELAGQ